MDELFERIWKKKIAFIGAFFLVFTFSYILLVAVDFLPEKPEAEEQPESATEAANTDDFDEPEVVVDEPVTEEQYENEVEKVVEKNVYVNPPENSTYVSTGEEILPLQISIKKIGKVVTVLNPTSRTIADLDQALLDGVVRHPDSATLDQDGNVFLLGHSSYLPNVFNKNFQAFNGIQNLEWGDSIEVFSGDMVYEYRVEKVYRATAQDLTIPIAGTGKILTLATCNSFGSVDDRYIVESKQIGVRKI